LDFQCIRNGNDVYFTVNAIGLADRIAILDEKLVNYRVNQNSGLVCSLSKSPLSPIQAWIDIAENLEKYDGFGAQSFANKAMGSMIYMLQNLQEWDAFRQAVMALKEYGLEKMHIIPDSGDYYYNKWNGACVNHLYKDTPEEFAVFFAYSVYTQKAEAYAEKRGLSQDLSLQKKKNKELSKKLKSAKKQLEDKKLEYEELNCRFSETENDVKKKNAKIKKIERELKKNKEDISCTNEKLEYIVTESENTKKELGQAVNELEKARRELEKTKKELEKTRNSWSFRIGKAITCFPGKIKRMFKHK
jgi:hypothetical protein